MINSEGFYKNDNGCLLYGPNYVLSGSYNLYKDQKEFYEYPIFGWYWFDSEDEARLFFNLPPKEPQSPNFLSIINNGDLN